MGPLEDFVGCTIKCGLSKKNIKISQPHLILKMTQLFNKDVKSLVTGNCPATPYKGIVRNQETDPKISNHLQKR